MHWKRSQFANRMGLGGAEANSEPLPALIGKADVDPATRGMLAATVGTVLDGKGGTGDIALHYWYRRPNGQSADIALFDVEVAIDEAADEEIVGEIRYRGKPLLGDLSPERRVAAREILLHAIMEVTLHLRAGGSPAEIAKILDKCRVQDIVREDIVLPGQNKDGKFSFKVSDAFNPAARGDIAVEGNDALLETIIAGEVNTLDDHRRIDGGARTTYRTNFANGVTFASHYDRVDTNKNISVETSLEPACVPEGETARPFKNLLKAVWKKTGRRNSGDKSATLQALQFAGINVGKLPADDQIRVLGAAYWMTDQIRLRRYPTALDAAQRFDLTRMFSPVDPPGPEGRFSVVSYLGDDSGEVYDGFGYDLGACKVATYEWWDDKGDLKTERVMLDLGKLLAPQGSDHDGGLPDVVNILRDPSLKGIFITHRHLDHMGAIIELARLGLLQGKDIHGSEGDLYILKNQLRAELGDKRLMPNFCPIAGEGIIDFERLSVEYCVDCMDHSTKSNAYRTVARRTEKTRNLTPDEIAGSYLFYGDARDVLKPEFLGRGMRSFGVERQDTRLDVDITNAKKPGEGYTEEQGQKNILDFVNCFPNDGALTAIISTNDSRLKSLYKVCNRALRNLTGIGHNVELSLRKQNKTGVDPEYEHKYIRENINKFMADDAREETQRRIAPLLEKLEKATDKKEIASLNRSIRKLTVYPSEFRSRSSGTAQSWLSGNLGRVMGIITGTQGNPKEMFSTLYRFMEGWSTLDSSRPSAYKVKNPKQWVVLIDNTAIPGNAHHQQEMIKKLLANRRAKCVAVAVEDGLKVYGLDEKQAASFIRKYIKDGRDYYQDKHDGSIVVTNSSCHPSGHAYKKMVEKIVLAANADITVGTHSKDPENTVVLHKDICEPNNLRHSERQFFNSEYTEVAMGATPAQSKVESIGRDNYAMIVYKIIRRWGDFFGGTLRASRVVNFDGRTGYAERGIFADDIDGSFEQEIGAVDFARAARRSDAAQRDERIPEEAAQGLPQERRRYRGPIIAETPVITMKKREKILDFVRGPGAAA